MNEQQFTLEWVNRLRHNAGYQILDRLPAGEQEKPGNCVVSRSLRDIDATVMVFKEGIFTDNKEFAKIIAESFNYNYELTIRRNSTTCQYGVPVPVPMSSFIDNFDDGLYPELVLSH